MGLDLLPMGRPNPGCEAEWTKLIEPLFQDQTVPEGAWRRANEISIAAFADVGAPRVGLDPEATEWITSKWKPENGKSLKAFLAEHEGYYVLDLVKNCDGLPRYCNAGMGYEIDQTSFRGAFLDDCKFLLGDELHDRAWKNMRPDEAVSYGKALLEIAERTAKQHGLSLDDDLDTDDEDDIRWLLDILKSAGRWYVFWGKRGHAIQAWF